MKFLKIVFAAILSVSLSACANRVPLFKYIASPDAETVRVAVDRHGSIYPDDLYLHTNDLQLTDFSLKEYFRKTDCTNLSEESIGREICQLHHDEENSVKSSDIDPKESLEKLRSIEKTVWQQKAVEITNALESTNRDLAILIHGFNDSTPELTFLPMKKLIKSSYYYHRKETPLFLEVVWDGTDSALGWPKAQFSGPLVGLELRLLLNEVASTLKAKGSSLPNILVTTHSSGAYVIGSTLGNPSEAWNYKSDALSDRMIEKLTCSQNECCDAGPYKLPDYPSIGLAMYAPATPSNTFVGIIEEGSKKAPLGLQANNLRVGFSINENDYALNKVMPRGFFWSRRWLGATHTGADQSVFKRFICKGFQFKERDLTNFRFNAFNFNDNASESFWLTKFLFWSTMLKTLRLED